MAAVKTFSAMVDAVAQEVTAGGAVVHMLVLYNRTAAVAYLQIFAKPVSGVTVGTTTPDHVVPVAPGQSLPLDIPDSGWFIGGTGMTVAATTGRNNNTSAQMDVLIGF